MYVGINSDILCVSLRSLSRALAATLRRSLLSGLRLRFGIFNLFDVIILSIFEFSLLCSAVTNEPCVCVSARARNSHFLSIASLLIPIAYAAFAIFERCVPQPLIAHMWSESSGHRTEHKNKTKTSSEFLSFVFCLSVVRPVPAARWNYYYNLFYAGKSVCPMSIYKQYVVTLFIDIFAVSFGQLSLNWRRRPSNAVVACASSAPPQPQHKQIPIELLLFLFMAKMMVITSSEVHKFRTRRVNGHKKCVSAGCRWWLSLVVAVESWMESVHV